MNDVTRKPEVSKGKDGSLEKFRERWLSQLILHRGIKGSVLKVAIVIAYHMNRKSGLAFPGVRRIRRLTSLSLSTISAAVNWLEANGHLNIQRGRTSNVTSRYAPLLGGKTEQGVRPVRTPAFAPAVADLPTYLPKEPPSYTASIDIDAPRKGSARKEEKGTSEIVSGLKGPASTESPLPAASQSLIQKCFVLARDYEGEVGASRVAKALRQDGYGREEEVLERIIETINDGGNLGEALAEFWESSWKTWRTG